MRPPPLSASLRRTFAALEHRNYRLWFFGQMASLVGTWTQMTAQGYLVFELTRSTAYLGYVGFSAGVSSWLFMLYGGVVADRRPRRRLLLLTQVSMMLLSLILAALTFSGRVAPWHIVGLAFLVGVANAFDAPARQAFVLEMVDRAHLDNAIALNSMMFNIATTFGPAVAGLVYAVAGPGWCFTLNAVSFLAVIGALLAMRLTPRPVAPGRSPPVVALGEGLRFAVRHPGIRTVLVTAMAATLFGIVFAPLLPDWAVTVLGGDARTNGWLQSARGFGALGGAVVLAWTGRSELRWKLLMVGLVTFPAVQLVFAQLRWLPLSLAALVAIGWSQMVLFNSSNALLQTLVPDELRGRVMSVYTLTFFGLMPLAALWGGAVAAHIGSPATVTCSATVLLLAAVVLRGRWLELRST